MKAIVRTKYGTHDVLKIQTLLKPTPQKNEVLVKVYVTTVNRTDYAVLSGKPFVFRFFIGGLYKPKNLILGTDFAGIVVATGNDVKLFQIGDRVWGFNDQGLSSQAEYMTISENKAIITIPDNITYQEIVACAEGVHYAYNILNKITINKGDRIFINGATGAIGSSLLQFSKNYGAKITATANRTNMKLIKSLGADRVLDYTKEDFTKENNKYNFIFDTVIGSSFSFCKHLLEPKGTYISTELGKHAEHIYLPLITKFSRKKQVIFPIPANCKRSILFIKKLIEQKKFQPLIDKVYTLEQAKKAYEYVASGQKIGNVILKITE